MEVQDRHLILPCETRFREFDAKLLLACHAAERGWRVVVGSMRAMDKRILRLPRGVYINKGVTRHNYFFARNLPRLGYVYLAWDEEGLVYASPEVYRATKVDVRSLNQTTQLLAWGEENARAWREHPGFAGTPISVTGNPRFDLLRSELREFFADEADRLRSRYGKFILVNTNFSRLNHFIPGKSPQRRLIEDGGGRIVSDDDPRLGLAAHKKRLFDQFLEMVPAVARRFPDHRLVLRPHPSESPEAWREALADCPNAEVVYEGNVAAWLMAAGALVHNGCTTAVESFLLDRPAIAYQPVVSDQFDHPLPNRLSRRALDLEELFEKIADTLGSGDDERACAIAKRRDFAKRHIASYDGPSACENIIALLDQIAASGTIGRPGLLDRLIARAQIEGRQVVKFIRRHVRGAGIRAAYAEHTFTPLTTKDVSEAIARFGSVLGRFDGLSVEDLGDSIFMISPTSR